MSQRADRKPSTLKRMIWTIVGTLALIAVIAGVKVLLVVRMIHSMPAPAPVTVSTVKAAEQPWQPSLAAVGSLRAVKGADLAAEAAGLVTQVNLQSGQDVKQGQLLVQLRDGDETAQLQQLQANAELSKITLERARKQVSAQAISQADFDTAQADYKARQAAVAQQQVVVAKKQLRAPFDGRAGMEWGVYGWPETYVVDGKGIIRLKYVGALTDDVVRNQIMPAIKAAEAS